MFNYHTERFSPPWVSLDTLKTTHGVDPEDLLADDKAPLVVMIGPTRYVFHADLGWFLHRCAIKAFELKNGRHVGLGSRVFEKLAMEAC